MSALLFYNLIHYCSTSRLYKLPGAKFSRESDIFQLHVQKHLLVPLLHLCIARENHPPCRKQPCGFAANYAAISSTLWTMHSITYADISILAILMNRLRLQQI